MTNNPDTKAPDLIWAGTGLYHDYVDDWSEGYWYNEKPDFHVVGDIKEVEYTRTDAITPQQAAKVLLMVEHIEMIEDVAKEFRVHPATLRACLKALADSKEIDG